MGPTYCRCGGVVARAGPGMWTEGGRLRQDARAIISDLNITRYHKKSRGRMSSEPGVCSTFHQGRLAFHLAAVPFSPSTPGDTCPHGHQAQLQVSQSCEVMAIREEQYFPCMSLFIRVESVPRILRPSFIPLSGDQDTDSSTSKKAAAPMRV